MRPALTLTLAFALAAAALLAGCASLPPLEGRSASTAFTNTSDTRLGKAIAAAALATPRGRSGIYPLAEGHDAFAARALLAAVAERSLDVQYYIWHGDTTGKMLFRALLEAADRGVRVRLLLDDNNTKGLDDALVAMDAHPNVEVRLFNPFPHRSARLLDYAFDFSRTNRRMHNKSFTADNQATIVGGRNIGDEYFAAGEGPLFADLDVLAVGPIVQDVSRSFDQYWASESAYPVASVVRANAEAVPEALRSILASNAETPEAAEYLMALRAAPMVAQLLEGKLDLEWVETRLVADDPGKVLAPVERTDLHLLPRLQAAMGAPTRQLDLVSPYFVPGVQGTEALTRMATRGVRVRVLTNSLAATDVAAVHAGYAKRREALLAGGVRLYELKREVSDVARHPKRRIISSAGASLHAKTFAIDESRIFVGSFNFDPRSAKLNTEMGLVIESPTLARLMSSSFDEGIGTAAYELALADDGGLRWIERTDADETITHESEPATSAMRRFGVHLLSHLPIEWLL